MLASWLRKVGLSLQTFIDFMIYCSWRRIVAKIELGSDIEFSAFLK